MSVNLNLSRLFYCKSMYCTVHNNLLVSLRDLHIMLAGNHSNKKHGMAANRISSLMTILLAMARWVTNIDYVIFHYITTVKHPTRIMMAIP